MAIGHGGWVVVVVGAGAVEVVVAPGPGGGAAVDVVEVRTAARVVVVVGVDAGVDGGLVAGGNVDVVTAGEGRWVSTPPMARHTRTAIRAARSARTTPK